MSERNGPDVGAVYQLLTEVVRIVSGHDLRFDALEARLDEQDRRFDEHAGKLNELVVIVNGHTRKLDELADIVNRHDRKLDDLAAGFADLRETLTH